MNTTTMHSGYATDTREDRKTGFWSRLFQSMIAAREAEARRRIAIHFANVPDRRLYEIGMSARDIEMIRSGQRVRIDLAG